MATDDISSHDIDYVEYVGPGLTWGKIWSTCVKSMWSNDTTCKYMFMFPLQNLACKELNQNPMKYRLPITYYSITQPPCNYAHSTEMVLSCCVRHVKVLSNSNGYYGRTIFLYIWVLCLFRKEILYCTAPWFCRRLQSVVKSDFFPVAPFTNMV